MPLFGKKKTTPPPKESIAKLRETLDMLEKREQFLQKKIDGQTAEAKKFMAAKNKRGNFLPSFVEYVAETMFQLTIIYY